MAIGWPTSKRKKQMNPSLLQRPTKVKPNTNVKYIYAPSVLTEGCKLEPGTVIKVLEVHKGKTKDETMLKVVTDAAWQGHVYGIDHKRDDDECGCKQPINEMIGNLKNNVFFVLLSDIGK